MLNDGELTVSVPEVLLVSNCNTLGETHIIATELFQMTKQNLLLP